MRNAHERFGALTFTHHNSTSDTRVRVTLDRYFGEPVERPGQTAAAHLLSVVGGDSDIAAVWAAVASAQVFTIEGPTLMSRRVTLGPDAVSFRGSLVLPGRKRPARHLVALSAALATGSAPQDGALILCDGDPLFVAAQLAHRLGVPLVPAWAGWLLAEMVRHRSLCPLDGLGCRPVAITATRESLLDWIGAALREGTLALPVENGPVRWPAVSPPFFPAAHPTP